MVRRLPPRRAENVSPAAFSANACAAAARAAEGGPTVKRSVRMCACDTPCARSEASTASIIGPADEGGIERRGIDEAVEDEVRLGAIEATVEEIEIVVDFVLEEVVEREAGKEPVLQIGKLVEEHDRLAMAVAVEKGEAAVRFLDQRGLEECKDRRDARAACDPQIIAGSGGIEGPGEAAVGGHDVDFVAALEVRIGPAGEDAPRDGFYRDAQFALVRGGAERIVAADVRAIDVGAQRDVLAGGKGEGGTEVSGNIEQERDAVGGLVADLRDGERVEGFVHAQLGQRGFGGG
jgi:hypothetical protein